MPKLLCHHCGHSWEQGCPLTRLQRVEGEVAGGQASLDGLGAGLGSKEGKAETGRQEAKSSSLE